MDDQGYRYTYPQYVILIALPLQQWLHERASLFILYVHCLVRTQNSSFAVHKIFDIIQKLVTGVIRYSGMTSAVDFKLKSAQVTVWSGRPRCDVPAYGLLITEAVILLGRYFSQAVQLFFGIF